jgi:hypothetical protein
MVVGCGAHVRSNAFSFALPVGRHSGPAEMSDDSTDSQKPLSAA